MPVSAGDFYETYHGHTVEHLETVHRELRGSGTSQFVFLAGDSTLDNKHWFFEGFSTKKEQMTKSSTFVADALNGHERVLSPPLMVKDVSYWLNHECMQRSVGGQQIACLNCAVEESSILQREEEGLRPADIFIRDHITSDDILVVNVGGNDVALRPSLGVILNMAWLLYLTPKACISVGPFMAPGLWYFIHMFSKRIGRYIEQLTAKCKPEQVIACMLYFLDEKPGGSWADGTLQKLGYNTDPEKLQSVIRQVYSWGMMQIKIPGTIVVPLPLYEVLDGKDTEDYAQRVEPSVQGGQKMAKAMAEKIFAS